MDTPGVGPVDALFTYVAMTATSSASAVEPPSAPIGTRCTASGGAASRQVLFILKEPVLTTRPVNTASVTRAIIAGGDCSSPDETQTKLGK